MLRSPGVASSMAVLAASVLVAWGPLAFSQPEPERKPAAGSQDTPDQRKNTSREAASAERPAPRNQPATNAQQGTQPGTQDVSLVMTPGREAAALKFAQLHHPELERLLARLENNNPAEYRRAVRKLYQDSERLARTAERSPDRHELELDAWKLDSRIRLLVARMSMSSDNEKLDSQLQALLQERVDLRLRQLRGERERIESRLARLTETIDEIESDPTGAALKDLQRVKRSLGIPPNRRTPPADRPARSRPTATETER